MASLSLFFITGMLANDSRTLTFLVRFSNQQTLFDCRD
jgi:hypothetical protein